MKKDKLNNITSTGFKTPDNYFVSFEAKLQKRLSNKETIEGVEHTGYVVPKGYFESFEDNLLENINQDKPVITLQPKRKLYYIAGIAASFILLFGVLFNLKKDISIESIDTLAIESYLYQEDYSNDELASLFKPNEISVNDFIDLNISDETLNQYLETIDTEELILD
ncbi:hypothetical protein [Winogradskyella pulchriflava]|uniref:Uncharacterized protein n=1 Tax=Winogradskyella pulchriflava TaxID=1110688 RepID=A0ABV6QBH0_9FLAO